MIVSILISFYSTRLILKTLGASDYGLYMLIGGIVSMLSFLNTTLATSTQRHISFSLGRKNINEIKSVFGNSILLHFVLGILLVIVFESLGYFFLETKLNIDPSRVLTAKTLYHFVVISTFVTIIAVPYDGLINAKENMLFLSITSILDSVLKLLIALILLTNLFDDKLFYFGLFMLIKALLIRLLKQLYCKKKYSSEVKVNYFKVYNSVEIKGLASFAGWNLLGVLSYMFKNQGIAIVLNLFYNTVINAAYGIANQINSQLKMFSDMMIQAVQPQMVKSESSGDGNRMINLSVKSSKFSILIFGAIFSPLILNLEFFLKIWLDKVPEATLVFCYLILLLSYLQQFRTGVISATHARGNIKQYQIFNAPIQLLVLPLGYFLLWIGLPSYYIIVGAISVELIVVVLNIIFFKKMTSFGGLNYLISIILPGIYPLSVTLLVSITFNLFVIGHLFNNSLSEALLSSVISIALYLFSVYLFSLDRTEKNKLKALYIQLKKKIYDLSSNRN